MDSLLLKSLDPIELSNYTDWFSDEATDLLFKEPDNASLEAMGMEAWSAVLNNEVVAVAHFSKSNATGSIYLAVDPTKRRLGIGSEFMELLLQEIKLEDLLRIRVNVGLDNVTGQEILTKTGFVNTGESEDGLMVFERRALPTK